MEGDFGIDHILKIIETLLWLLDPARHFLYSAISGFLAFRLTLTTFSAFGWIWERLTQRRVNSAVGFTMLILSLLCGVALSLYVHHLLDYGWGAWDLPFNGASMNLKMP